MNYAQFLIRMWNEYFLFWLFGLAIFFRPNEKERIRRGYNYIIDYNVPFLEAIYMFLTDDFDDI